MVDALPPPEILARLIGPQSTCTISFTYTDAESGNVTSARCGGRRYIIARDYHGDSVRRLNRCAVMLTIEGIRFPRVLKVDNCHGSLKVRDIGAVWTRQLAASARITLSRVDRVLFYPVARRPACYRVAIIFTPPGKPANTPLDERSAVRCDRRKAGRQGKQQGDGGGWP